MSFLRLTRPVRTVKRRAIAGALVCACVAAIFVILQISTSALADDPKRVVSVVTARNAPLVEKIAVVGSIVATEETFINADVDGLKIETVSAEAADRVVRGQLLATLDVAKVDADQARNDAQKQNADALVGQAQASILVAAATKDEADANLQRSLRLSAKGLVTTEAVEQRRNDFARADAGLVAAQQSLKVAEAAVLTAEAERRDIAVRRTRTKIVATTDGKIITRSAKVGAMTSATGGPLFVIANSAQVELEAEVPQAQLFRLKVGAAATVSVGIGIPPLEGHVRLVAPSIAGQTRLGRVRIALPTGLDLPIGAFAKADVDAAVNEGVFLPSSAVVDAIDGSAVQIIEHNKVELKTVQTGVRIGGVVEIRSGITAGDVVVLRAASFLSAGDAVSSYQVSYETGQVGATTIVSPRSVP
jgi:HlyD family secretion protein